ILVGPGMDDSRIGLVLDGRYAIQRQVGAGGMGVVYRGVRVGLDRPVAIKFLHRSAARVSLRRRRFEREARAMARLAHPNLVSVIDHGSHAGVPYLVMDYQEGASLRQALAGGALEPARAVAIARQIAAG